MKFPKKTKTKIIKKIQEIITKIVNSE